MQEKQRIRDQAIQDDRSETKKLASHPDPYHLNKNRHHNFFQKTNKIQDFRSHLYKSQVLSKINHQQKEYDDMVSRSVNFMHEKNKKMASSFQNQRRQNLANHYNFVKNQAETNRRSKSMNITNQRKQQKSFRDSLDSQMRVANQHEKEVKRRNQQEHFQYLEHQMKEKKRNDNLMNSMTNTESMLNRSDINVRICFQITN